jgi:hypothetical protein
VRSMGILSEVLLAEGVPSAIGATKSSRANYAGSSWATSDAGMVDGTIAHESSTARRAVFSGRRS